MTPLTATEAAALTERAVALAHELNGVLTELYERDAAGALGMTWRAYVRDYFGMSPSWFYDTLKAENIRAKLQGAGVLGALDTLSKRAALALAKLGDDMSIAAYEVAARTQRPVTEPAIMAAVESIQSLMLTGAVDIGGEQHTVKEALALSVQASERERVNAGREYLVANAPVVLQDAFSYGNEATSVLVWFNRPDKEVYEQLFANAGVSLRISIWRVTE